MKKWYKNLYKFKQTIQQYITCNQYLSALKLICQLLKTHTPILLCIITYMHLLYHLKLETFFVWKRKNESNDSGLLHSLRQDEYLLDSNKKTWHLKFGSQTAIWYGRRKVSHFNNGTNKQELPPGSLMPQSIPVCSWYIPINKKVVTQCKM